MGSEGEMINLHPSIPGSRLENIININHYATKKSVAESMLDVALFMANAAQLKAVLEQGTSFQYYAVLTALITISLFFQTAIGILLIIIARMNLNDSSSTSSLLLLVCRRRVSILAFMVVGESTKPWKGWSTW
ncbi:ninjurinninjurin-2 [Podarcis lilfordi]|uniref:Ninjurinninjurin-2 n=1 Tax=Podarcis lilfordi TaxID=74358 RepID=A0AA35KZF6_9SAUR|nr:ninjurinninjurin-2 [Podarcis lilfordi]